ncbi:hypothetical protein ACLKA7_001083 [Drosophila subpalustris]
MHEAQQQQHQIDKHNQKPGLPSNKNNNNSEQKELQLRATKAINHFERKGQAESEKMEPDLCPSLMVAHQRIRIIIIAISIIIIIIISIIIGAATESLMIIKYSKSRTQTRLIQKLLLMSPPARFLLS